MPFGARYALVLTLLRLNFLPHTPPYHCLPYIYRLLPGLGSRHGQGNHRGKGGRR